MPLGLSFLHNRYISIQGHVGEPAEATDALAAAWTRLVSAAKVVKGCRC